MRGGELALHLIDRLKEKDERALVEVMNKYGDYLFRTAFLLVKDHQRAEEAVQDTFITAFEKIDQLHDPEKLKSWLTTITLNCCRSQLRKWSIKHIFPSFDLLEWTKEDDTVQSPEETILQLAWNKNISEAIQQLDYKYREVITLYYFNELKIAEIATHIQAKENTVKSRLKRGRSLLKDLLVKGDGFDAVQEGTSKKTTRS